MPTILFNSVNFSLRVSKSLPTSYPFGSAPPRKARRGPGFLPKSVADFTGKPSKAALAAREHMRRHGWSYRRAAAALECSHPHLALVLTGHRISHSLCRRVLDLPSAK